MITECLCCRQSRRQSRQCRAWPKDTNGGSDARVRDQSDVQSSSRRSIVVKRSRGLALALLSTMPPLERGQLAWTQQVVHEIRHRCATFRARANAAR